jgi:regulatory protein
MDDPSSTSLTVTQIVSGKSRMRLLRLSDGRDFIFSEEACDLQGVEAGMAVDEGLLAELETAEQRVQAHEAALRLLSTRSRSENEMRTRLRMRGVEPEIIEDEIQRLHAAGLLDDEKFARAWVEDRKRTSPRGRRMLRYELLGRGIAPEAVDRATGDVDDMETALDLARSRARRTDPADYQSFVTKVGGFLRRRGFSYDVVMEATRTVWMEMGGGRPEEPLAEAP